MCENLARGEHECGPSLRGWTMDSQAMQQLAEAPVSCWMLEFPSPLHHWIRISSHDLLLLTYPRTPLPLEPSDTRIGNAEFQVKTGHHHPGATWCAPAMQPCWQPHAPLTSPEKICPGPLEGVLKQSRQVIPFPLRKIADAEEWAQSQGWY